MRVSQEVLMDGPIVVGLDASPESVAAADWAAREAALRGLPVELVQAWPKAPAAAHRIREAEEGEEWGRRVLARMEIELRTRHAGVEVTTAQIPRPPVEVLSAAGHDASMLVLGSRALGGLRGFLLGSVSQAVLARVACPVVLVRAGRGVLDEHQPGAEGIPTLDTPYWPVALGLGLRRPCDDLLSFAFETAAHRAAPLHAVHAWSPPPGFGHAASPLGAALIAQRVTDEEQLLEEALRPWREKYPQVRVVQKAIVGSAASILLEAVPQAGLVVVGRHDRGSALGIHLGPVTHAALHHATCPVAVVPYR